MRKGARLIEESKREDIDTAGAAVNVVLTGLVQLLQDVEGEEVARIRRRTVDAHRLAVSARIRQC